ncbi:hypothetical protein [Streptomyces decoyicus]|uniref:hypothetical protein n=1 Tax=Streptomyces decoyicus TaxID=249567 RepID=UPI00339DF12B
MHGASETAAALAVAYATKAIDRPQLLDPELLYLSREQRGLVPLIAQEMTAAQMATALKRRSTSSAGTPPPPEPHRTRRPTAHQPS